MRGRGPLPRKHHGRREGDASGAIGLRHGTKAKLLEQHHRLAEGARTEKRAGRKARGDIKVRMGWGDRDAENAAGEESLNKAGFRGKVFRIPLGHF